jgi:hypothetical protein
MMSDQYPGWAREIGFLLLFPSIAIVFYFLARGWVSVFKREEAREKAVTELRKVALAMMLAGYVVYFGTFLYVHYVLHQ